MKKYSVVLFIVLINIFLVSSLFAQKNLDSLQKEELIDSVQTLNNRLKADYYMFKEGGFKERLEAESKKWEAEAQNFKADVRNENWLVAFIVFACGGISIGLIAIFYTRYKKNLEELVKTQETESKTKLENLYFKYEQETNIRIEKLKEEQEQKIRHLDRSFLEAISDLVKSSPENLRKLIHTREEEYKLIRNAEILVISAAEKDGNELRDLFSNYGFDTNKIEYVTLEKYDSETDKTTYKTIKKREAKHVQMWNEGKKPEEIAQELAKEEYQLNSITKLFDVVLFNNENQGLIKEIDNLKNYEENYLDTKRVYFYYGTGTIRGFKNANFANSPFTFYNNILALLRHKK